MSSTPDHYHYSPEGTASVGKAVQQALADHVFLNHQAGRYQHHVHFNGPWGFAVYYDDETEDPTGDGHDSAEDIPFDVPDDDEYNVPADAKRAIDVATEHFRSAYVDSAVDRTIHSATDKPTHDSGHVDSATDAGDYGAGGNDNDLLAATLNAYDRASWPHDPWVADPRGSSA